jgi:type II secretory ATPase GspE/PulE/Tfp pilus assembly ATPase PilB-like protein
MAEKNIGELLVEHNLVSEMQVAEALSQKLVDPEKTLGQLLCQMGFLKKNDLERILDQYKKRQKMGEILVKRNIINEDKLIYALKISQETKTLLGQTLLKLHFVEEEHLAQCLASQYDLPYVSLSNLNLGPELSMAISHDYAQKHKIVPISKVGNMIILAMSFPDQQLVREIELSSNLQITPVISIETEIVEAQDAIYRFLPENRENDSGAQQNIEIYEELRDRRSKHAYTEEVITSETEHLVKSLIMAGIRCRASDIHLEQGESNLQIRYRVDGVLQTIDLGLNETDINRQCRAIIAKIKTLCKMDIAEKNRPQDGSFRMRIAHGDSDRMIDFRVSTLQTQFGEDIMIRVLDKQGLTMSLPALGVAAPIVEGIHATLEMAPGMYLVVGPAGSGRSATLHALLSRITLPGQKSLSVEDPIKYVLEDVRQTEVNEAIGNNFANIIRAFMRQSPDNILISELRDPETATLAIQAVLAGHTILSSLQTNDVTSAVTRLLDLGIEPDLAASALRCVIAQRLVRINCEKCRENYSPYEQILQRFGLPAKTDFPFYRGKGCPDCNDTGFSGRMPVVELWIPTDQELLQFDKRLNNTTLRNMVFNVAERHTMAEDGMRLIKQGVTTLEELIRVLPHTQIVETRTRIEQGIFRWDD